VCGSTVLSVGWHDIKVHGFQHGGGIYQTADYSGPDTGGQTEAIYSQFSQEDISALPAVPTASVWRMKVFAANRGLSQVPAMASAGAQCMCVCVCVLHASIVRAACVCVCVCVSPCV